LFIFVIDSVRKLLDTPSYFYSYPTKTELEKLKVNVSEGIYNVYN